MVKLKINHFTGHKPEGTEKMNGKIVKENLSSEEIFFVQYIVWIWNFLLCERYHNHHVQKKISYIIEGIKLPECEEKN